jgi:hypothetical protein
MRLLDFLILLVAALAVTFAHTPIGVTIVVALALILVARLAAGERLP